MINTSLICLSLKYLSKYYELASNVSKWVYFELTKVNYKEIKFIKSLTDGDFETIKTLIKFNKNTDLISECLVYSCLYKNYNSELIKLLIDNGADIHAEDDYVLRLASQNGCVEIVKILIDNGADIHAEDDEALKLACKNRYVKVVKLLIDNGANIHAEDDYALRLACKYGYIKIVKLLIDNGANIHVEDNCVLKIARQYNHRNIIKLLK